MIYKEIREQLNLYQWEMAEELEVSENAYKKYELGYCPMPDHLKIKILSMEKNNRYKDTVNCLKKINKNLRNQK